MRLVFAGWWLVACGGGEGSTGLSLPIEGVDRTDFVLAYYVDGDATTGFRDYMCGGQTYDGNVGTQFVLHSFADKARGVDVLAAAPGVVLEIHDGEPDLNVAFEGTGLGNVVILEHEDGYVTRYGHLAKGLRVAMGDRVERGQVLGLVGSSGASDTPHLSFEVAKAGVSIDPHVGPCGGRTDESWTLPDQYDASFRVVASGVSDQYIDRTVVKIPPRLMRTFTTASPGVSAWIELVNTPSGREFVFDAIDPDGMVRSHYTFLTTESLVFGWVWVNQPIRGVLPSVPGEWTIRIRQGDVTLLDEKVTIAAAVSPPTARSAGAFGEAGVGAVRFRP